MHGTSEELIMVGNWIDSRHLMIAKLIDHAKKNIQLALSSVADVVRL